MMCELTKLALTLKFSSNLDDRKLMLLPTAKTTKLESLDKSEASRPNENSTLCNLRSRNWIFTRDTMISDLRDV